MIYRNVLAQHDVDRAMEIYWDSLTNDSQGEFESQTYPGDGGVFLVSQFDDALPFLWDKVKVHTGGTLSYCRILRYGPGGYIKPHVDVGTGVNTESNVSVIIQLSDPDSYEGGIIIAGGDEVHLNVGDIVAYEYGVMHEVTPITKGLRFVCNLRIYV